MSIEKPISTIRRAVEGAAETKAAKEFIKKPESRHIQEAFALFKQLRDLDPKFLKYTISTIAKAKELKEEMGEELDSVFSQVWEDINEKYGPKIGHAIEQIKETGVSKEEEMIEIREMAGSIVKKMLYEIKNDSTIVSAFKGKEALLNKATDYFTMIFPSLIEYYVLH